MKVLVNLQSEHSGGSVKPKFDVVCRECKAVGHYACDCPQRGRGKQESSGKSTSKSAALTASAPASTPSLDSFSVQQLEQHIAQRKLADETSQLQNASTDEAHVGTVLSTNEVSDVVGPRPHITLEIEGVSARALVDTGSQSTII